jgi:hypothetical protein
MNLSLMYKFDPDVDFLAVLGCRCIISYHQRHLVALDAVRSTIETSRLSKYTNAEHRYYCTFITTINNNIPYYSAYS